MPRTRPPYPPEFRREAVRMVRSSERPISEAARELVERASFPQNRAGLRSLERWAKRFPQRRWAVENAGGLGVGTWREGWRRQASR